MNKIKIKAIIYIIFITIGLVTIKATSMNNVKIKHIACLGDSLTAGTRREGVTYPLVLQQLTGIGKINKGIGRQTSAQIAARFGVVPVTVSIIKGGIIPKEGFVDIVNKKINNLYDSGYFQRETIGSICGVAGRITTDVSGNWRFYRFKRGKSIKCPSNAIFIPNGKYNKTDLFILWLGRNNYGDTEAVLHDIKAFTDKIQKIGCKFIILSVMNGDNPGEKLDGSEYRKIIELNNRIKNKYQNHYLDIRQVVVNSYNPKDTADLKDYERDIVPISLREDAIHLNKKGYQLVAQVLYRYLTQKHIIYSSNKRHLSRIGAINNDKTSLSSKENVGKRLQECAIWGGERNPGIQQYVAFRRTFSIDNVSKAAQINIFADARYLLWINGHYIMRGPCRFNPSRPEYDMCNIAHYLHPGKNTIAVLVHYYGNCINGRIMKGQPTLSLCLCDAQTHKEYLMTDSLWKYTNKTCYQPAPESWNTVIDRIDGRIDGAEWTQLKYDDSSWGYAQYIDTSKLGQFMPNELPLPREKELTSLHQLPSGGLLDRYLPVTLKQGQELIVDYGIMTLAYTKIKLEATTNSVLSIRYALRYQEGKTFEEFGSGNRYTARSGMQEFMTTDQWGSHYMILRCDSGEVVIHGLKIIERRFPYKRSGRFVCNDTLLNDLWKMSVNTIEATSDDAYGTDARERNEWIQDAIKASFPCSLVALARPDGSGKSEMRLLKNMIRHAALSQLPDGRIRATFPTDRGDEDCHYFIDDYACQWFEALHTYFNMTGDIAFAREMFPHLKAQIGWFEKQKKTNGLYLLREYTSFDNPFAYITCEGTTVNGFYYQALTHASDIAHRLGEDEQASCYEVMRDDLYKHFNHILWDEQAKAYHSAIWNDTLCAPTVHAQLIALQSGIVPPERISSTREWLLKYYRNHSMFHCCTNNDVKHMVEEKCGIGMPIVYYWLFNELYKANTSKYDIEALNEMRRRWKYMVLCQKDIGTLSESFVNAVGERPSQSCHNYGVIPAYYLSSYVLGVRCEKPIKAKEIVIEPRLGDLQFAKGTVVTAYGLVRISWDCTASKDKVYFSISLPKGVTAILRLPTSKYQLPSFKHKKALCVGRWTVLKNIRGTCSGSFYKN